MSLPGVGRRRQRLIAGLFLAVAALPLIYSLGGHPVHGSSEARYATIARAMARGESSWGVPHLFDQPHLTKPPLTYWAMAASIRLLGENGWGVRLPAALSGLMSLGVVFWLADRGYGRRRAFLATALFSTMPLFVVVHRLGITDGLLGLTGLGVMAGGIAAVKHDRRAGRALLWGATAAGLMVKGPAAIPVLAAVLVWAAAGGPGGLRRTGLTWGVPLAAAPLLGWAVAVGAAHPGAWAVWSHEVIDRALGSGDHPQPWWFLLPVFAVGLLPATALWGWRGGREMNIVHRRSVARLLWFTIATVLAIYSLNSGKLFAYILPAAAPAAILAGGAVEHWLDGGPSPRVWCWSVRPAVTGWVGLTVLAAAGMVGGRVDGAIAARCGPVLAFVGLAGLVLVAAGVLSPRRRRLRTAALIGAWLCVVAAWMAAERIEDAELARHPLAALTTELTRATGIPEPHVMTVGFADDALIYPTNQPTRAVDPRIPAAVWNTLRRDDLVLLAVPERWDAFAADPASDLDLRYVQIPIEVRHGRGGQLLRAYRVRPEHW